MENNQKPKFEVANNQIHFEIKNGQVKCHMRKPMTVEEFLQVVQTGIVAILKNTVARVPDEQKQACTEDLYDLYNKMASNTLHYFAPEIEMRPDLTAQAILEAENKIIKEGRAPALKPKSNLKVIK